ncbi:hypothetical protein TNCV_4620331 [Trichonephila clavipes]|nr:hypothetical protein TNCV_4620331 [Trichonephila clavipes]
MRSKVQSVIRLARRQRSGARVVLLIVQKYPGKGRYPTCSIMVWAGIMIQLAHAPCGCEWDYDGPTTIQSEVLLSLMFVFSVVLSVIKICFMDDNATCHRTLTVQDWRQRGQVAGRNYPPTNKNTLIRALTEEWDKLPPTAAG